MLEGQLQYRISLPRLLRLKVEMGATEVMAMEMALRLEVELVIEVLQLSERFRLQSELFMERVDRLSKLWPTISDFRLPNM